MLATLAPTLLIEGVILFGFREKRARLVFLAVNVLTQLGLHSFCGNVLLLASSHFLFYALFLLVPELVIWARGLCPPLPGADHTPAHRICSVRQCGQLRFGLCPPVFLDDIHGAEIKAGFLQETHITITEDHMELELYIPKLDDLWFYQKMMADPATMSYNAGWDVSYDGYHPDTGCIDFPKEGWADWYADWVAGREPERFYAYICRKSDGAWIGDVNFHYTQSEDWRDLGVVIYAPYRGRGYGLPALELLLRRAFVHNSIPKLHNSFEETRAPGLAIHLRAGFRKAGTGEAARFGKPVKLLELELTREEYLETSKAAED